jgi:hypothetical protein
MLAHCRVLFLKLSLSEETAKKNCDKRELFLSIIIIINIYHLYLLAVLRFKY